MESARRALNDVDVGISIFMHKPFWDNCQSSLVEFQAPEEEPSELENDLDSSDSTDSSNLEADSSSESDNDSEPIGEVWVWDTDFNLPLPILLQMFEQ